MGGYPSIFLFYTTPLHFWQRISEQSNKIGYTNQRDQDVRSGMDWKCNWPVNPCEFRWCGLRAGHVEVRRWQHLQASHKFRDPSRAPWRACGWVALHRPLSCEAGTAPWLMGHRRLKVQKAHAINLGQNAYWLTGETRFFAPSRIPASSGKTCHWWFGGTRT